MIGIVLAGGSGSRLWPLTSGFTKQLLPVYDKPMIHYPIATLMAAGIKEIVIITTPNDSTLFQKMLGNGNNLGIRYHYLIQSEPRGLAEAFLIAEHLIANNPSALILGDNLFYGPGLGRNLSQYLNPNGCQIFSYPVSDPENFGVLELDSLGSVITIEEKPKLPKSNQAVTGLYFFDSTVVERAKKVRPSLRGELEITSVLQSYLDEDKLSAVELPRGTAWLDTGTFDNLHDAASFIRIVQNRQTLQIGNLNEVAWRQGWISNNELLKNAENSPGGVALSYAERLIREMKVR